MTFARYTAPAVLPNRRRRRYTSTLPEVVIASTTEISKQTDLSVSRQFAIDAARMLSDTRCHNVVVLDVSGISPVTDFLVVATGTSPVQMKSACDDVEELGEPHGFRALTRAGDSGTWTCIDLVDVVIHVFNHESRAYYDLDNLWGDASKVDWKESPAARE